MLRHESPTEDPGPGPLEPGEHLVAPPWRLIVWGQHRPLAGGPVSLSDRFLRFTPAWSGLEAMRHSAAASSSASTLRIPREEILRVSWERAMFFLKNLRLDRSGGQELHLLGGQEALQQLAAALEVRS